MRKIKFLNGIGAMLALAAVTFTSCEKEEFNVKFEANPAKVVFTPSVIDAATNVDVTDKATFAGNEAIVATTANKALEAGEVTITATVNGVSGTAKVKYPAVAAGELVSISPVILIHNVFDVAGTWDNGNSVTEYGNASTGMTHDHKGSTWGVNESDYFVPVVLSWNKTAKLTVESTDIIVPSNDLNEALAALKEKTVEAKGESEEFKASAWSMYRGVYTITEAKATYTFTAKASDVKVATAVCVNPIAAISAKLEEQAAPGHEGAWSHNHGHGHDGGSNSNAGGGISLAD